MLADPYIRSSSSVDFTPLNYFTVVIKYSIDLR